MLQEACFYELIVLRTHLNVKRDDPVVAESTNSVLFIG
jgi:hypothetical protein